MDEGLVAEPCLVGIEGVLLVLAVDGDQALVVLAVFAALRPGIGTEVEHIPAMGGPDIGTGEQLLDQFFVVVGLVFLGVVTLCRIGGVPVQCLTAVFADTDGDVGVFGVEIIQPGAVHIGLAAVPAEIVVVADKVGNGQQPGWSDGWRPAYERGRSGSGGSPADRDPYAPSW